MLYIGIDLGTSAVKLLLMDEKGNIKNIVSKEYPIFFPRTGWSEQNPEDWYEKTVEGIGELIDGFDKNKINGISFGGQMHGLVILDDNDEVIRPAILWNDGRTEKETNDLNQMIGKDKLSEYTANIAFAGFTAPKILWLKKHEPKNFEKICKIMLPKLYESYEVVGNIHPETAKSIGLPEKIKIIAGAGDNAAAAVGTGTIGDGKCNISLGTSGTIFISSDKFSVDCHNALHSFVHANGKFHLMGCVLSAASCNMWWMDKIIGTNDYEKEQKKIEKLGENHVYFLPYLMGERSPHNDPDARGIFIGLTMNTTKEDMTQAILEGVAFAIRDCFEVAKTLGIQIEQTQICGGGAKSTLWKKIIANVLNMRVDSVESEEGPGYGAAILASVGCGEYDNIEDAVNTYVKVSDTIKPDPGLVKKYDEKYKKFTEIYPAIKDLFPKIK